MDMDHSMTDALVLCAACGASTPLNEDLCPLCDGEIKLRDRFILRRIVGQGAVGITYEGLDTASGERVAIKEVPLRHTHSRDLAVKVGKEARILRELSHPQIPAYVDHFTEGSGKHRAFYLVQSFVPGPTLAEDLRRRRYTEADVVAIMSEVLHVFDYLHTLSPPVIHRDLKPGNLIRSEAGPLVLIDFGAVRDVLKDPQLGGSTVAGTYGFMAPEQFRGVATPQTDLYALGVLAVVLLSRQDPVDLVGPDHRLAWRGHVQISDGLAACLESLLASEPEARPASAQAVLDRLSRLNEPPQPVTPPVVEQTPPRRGLSRRPMIMDRLARRRMKARSKWMAALLAVVGSPFGVHNWYLGRVVRAIGSLMFFWTTVPFFMSIYDAFYFAFMAQQQFDEQYNPALIELINGDPGSLAEEIRALHQLLEDGLISQDEYERQKARLLGRSTGLLKMLGMEGLERLADQVERLVEVTPQRLLEELTRDRSKRR